MPTFNVNATVRVVCDVDFTITAKNQDEAEDKAQRIVDGLTVMDPPVIIKPGGVREFQSDSFTTECDLQCVEEVG